MRLSACTIDLTTRRVAGLGDPRLSTLEARLLGFLAERPGQTVSREDLLQSVWGYASEVSYRAVDVAVHRLRQKIEADPASPLHLLTIQGEGYVFVPPRIAPAWGGLLHAPRSRPGFVGREEGLGTLHGWFGTARTALLTGPPGVGKSRLAEEFAARCVGRTVLRVDLRAVDSLLELCAVLSSDDGAESYVAPAVADRLAGTGRSLAARGRCLLVLDNADLLVEELSDVLRAWTDAAPDLQLLVTSRSRIATPMNQWFVGPLEPAAAIALLRARLVEAGARLAGRDEAIERLAALLDGLPLAIELTAARAAVLEVDDLVALIEDRSHLRSGGDGPSLRAAIASSLDRLPAATRRLLARLTVFRGAFSLADVDAVADVPAETLDAITELVGASLIERGAAVDGRATWRLLRSVGDLAAEELDPLERAEARDRHAVWVAGRVGELSLHPSGELGLATLQHLDRLGPDLVRAWRWARTRDAETAVTLALALDGWWSTRGVVSERLTVLDSALSAVDDPRLRLARARALVVLGRTDAARADVDAVLAATAAGPPSSLRAVAFHEQAMLNELQTRSEAMMASLAASQAEAHAAGDRVFAAVADGAWAIGCRSCGLPTRTPEDLDAMLAAAAEALEGAGGRRQAVMALVTRVRGLCHQGRWDLVRPNVERALRLAEAEQLPFQRAHLEAQRALALEVAMELEDALDAWQASVLLLRRLGRSAEAECVQSRRAWTLRHLGRNPEARSECLAALHGRPEDPGPLLRYYTAVCLAGIALEEGDLATAIRHCEAAQPAVDEVFVAFGAHLRALHAVALGRAGRDADAQGQLQRALDAASQTQHGEVGTVVALAALAAGDEERTRQGRRLFDELAPKRLPPPILAAVREWLADPRRDRPALSWLRW